MMTEIATAYEPQFAALYDAMATETYHPDAKGAGRRSLRLACLAYLSRLDGGDRAQHLFASADNMTERQGALEQLIATGRAAQPLAEFEAQFRDNRLVMDKWFMVHRRWKQRGTTD